MRKFDLVWVPLMEGGLILLMGCISLAIGLPLLFASLGPTAYEQIEKAKLPSSRFYNVVVGHWIAIGSGFAAVAILHAWSAPNPLTANHFVPVRVATCGIAVALTGFFTLLAKAGQPAAYATALLIALGSMQRASDACAIGLAVLILGAIGEPIRRMRLKLVQEQETS